MVYVKMDLCIEDVLIRKVVTIDSEATVTDATDSMRRDSTSSLVVLSGKKIVGFLSTRDIVSRVVAKGLDPNRVHVKHVMSRPVIMARPDIPLGEAIKIMIQHKIKKLPLIVGEKDNANLVGMLSLTDMVEFHPGIFSTLWEEILITVPATAEEGEYCVAIPQ